MTFTIPFGTSTYEVPEHGTYGSCGDGGPYPPCVDGRVPPLPVGKYQEQLYQNPRVVRALSPTTVQVTRARR
jgi:hypothetical protein